MSLAILVALVIGGAIVAAGGYYVARHLYQFFPSGPAGQTAKDQFFYNARWPIVRIVVWGSALAGAFVAAFFSLVIFNIIPRDTVEVVRDRIVTREVTKEVPILVPQQGITAAPTVSVDNRIANAPCDRPFVRSVSNIRNHEHILLPNGCEVYVKALRGTLIYSRKSASEEQALVPPGAATGLILGGYLTSRGGTADALVYIVLRGYCGPNTIWDYDELQCHEDFSR